MFSLPRRRTLRSRRLYCESLEDRTVPAFSLAIDGDVNTDFVTKLTRRSTWHHSHDICEGHRRGLDVDDIEAPWPSACPHHDRNRRWRKWPSPVKTTFADDLDYSSATTRLLTIKPDSTSMIDNITLNNVALNFNNNIDR